MSSLQTGSQGERKKTFGKRETEEFEERSDWGSPGAYLQVIACPVTMYHVI